MHSKEGGQLKRVSKEGGNELIAVQLGIKGPAPQAFRRRRNAVRTKLQVYALQGAAVVRWTARTPIEALHAVCIDLHRLSSTSCQSLARHLHIPAEWQASQLQGTAFARAQSHVPPFQRLITFLREVLNFLIQPVGGHPVGVVEGVPGWHLKLVKGPRRWLGLIPGRATPVPHPGPIWTPSGLLHLLQNIPAGLWLILLGWIAYTVVQLAMGRLKAHKERRDQQRLISAAKASDLLLQRNRMLRAMGSIVASDVEGEEPAPMISEPPWQDPSEWAPATRRQWDEFMRKSKALKIRQEKWWDIDRGDDVPHHKAAHDKLRRAGGLPDYT